LWADRYPHGLSRQLIVYRWSNGDSIAIEDTTSIWAWSEAVAMLHSVPTDEVRRFSPHPLNLDFYWRIEQGSVTQIEHWLASSPLPLKVAFRDLATAAERLVVESLSLWEYAMPTAVHGDLSREHTLYDRGQITFLDWEMFGLGDPALDSARLLQREANALTQEQSQAWIESYIQFMRQPELAERINVYSRLLEFHNVVYLLVGLHQHALNQLESDLLDALPFLQSALATALDNAAIAFKFPEPPDSASLASHFFNWLVNTMPAKR
jgi:aminoglycoside phosphotransferase (APT) family kinase protein